MDLVKLPDEWANFGTLNQAGVIASILGLVLGILPLSGVQMPLQLFAFIFLILGVVLLVRGNIEQSRKLTLANGELSRCREIKCTKLT